MSERVIWSTSFSLRAYRDKFVVHAMIPDYLCSEPLKKMNEELEASGFNALYKCRMYEDDGAVMITFEVSAADAIEAVEKGMGQLIHAMRLLAIK